MNTLPQTNASSVLVITPDAAMAAALIASPLVAFKVGTGCENSGKFVCEAALQSGSSSLPVHCAVLLIAGPDRRQGLQAGHPGRNRVLWRVPGPL